MFITAGSIDVTVPAYFVDDVSGTNTGEPTTGLLFSNIETGGSASFQRQGEARTDFALVTVAVAAAHTDGGFILIDDTECPGLYRLDVPDAAFATGADWVIIYLRAAAGSNTIMRPIVIDLTRVDLRDVVRGGMTALPNVVVEGAGGLYTRGSGVGQINQPANGVIDTNLVTWLTTAPLALVAQRVQTDVRAMGTDVITAAALSAAAVDKIVDQTWDELLAGHVIADSTGLLLNDWQDGGRLDIILDAIPITAMRGTDGVDTAPMRGTDSAFLATADGSSLTAINLPNQTMDIIGNITGNLSGSVGSLTGHTPQTGDSFLRIGAGGASLSAIPNLDVAVSTRATPADLGAPQINVAFSDIEFLMVLTSDHVTPATGLTVTGEVSIDGAAFVGVAGTIAEISDGIYQFDATMADMNGATLMFRFSSGTADDTFAFIKTRA